MSFSRPRPVSSSPSTYDSHTAALRRADALCSYGIMETAEAEFDQLTKLAASVCETPLAAISLLDADRQWFKSRIGLTVSETPLDLSFCAHAIRRPREVMIVPDATADSRFRHHPMVAGQPGLRFYAGAPIVTPRGVAIGTICALDSRPRELTATQHDTMQCLAKWVVTFLEKRRNAATPCPTCGSGEAPTR